MSAALRRDCQRAARRAHTIQIRDFDYSIEGDTVTLTGSALTEDGIDSAVKLFEATCAGSVVNRLSLTPPDPSRPGSLTAGHGYVDIVHLGPDASRLVETITWEVSEGDTLSSIARAVYGDPSRIEAILNANRNQIPAGGHIHSGQRLRIPPA